MNTYSISMFSIYLALLILFWIGLSDHIRISCITNNPEAILKEKKRKIPRITLACIAYMYLHLLTIALRLFLFYDSLRYGGQIFDFICTLMVICVLSGLNLITVHTLFGIGMTSQIKRSWIALKLAFFPFLPLNVWLIGHSLDYINEVDGWAIFWLIMLLPFTLFLISLPLFILPLAINAIYGGIGISYIRHLRKQTGNNQQPSEFHFFLQMIPGFDLVSMLTILVKYRESWLDAKVSETDSVTVHSPYTPQSPYSPLPPNAYKAAPAKKTKIYEKLKKNRKYLFLLYLLCGILFYFSSEIFKSIGEVYEKITAEKTTFYEMTVEEIDLIQDFYWEPEIKEKIAAGQLTAFQAELLENLRIGSSYIESKYPDEQFQIEKIFQKYDDSYYIRDNHTTDEPKISYYTFSIVPVQPNGKEYKMQFSTSPDSVVQDNLYAYIQEASYFQYMEEQLAVEIPGFAKCDTDEWYDWYIAEYEDPADLTVEAVLRSECFAGPRFVDVYIAANGKTSDECKQQKEALREILHRIELPVERYTVYYYDLNVQEILVNDLNPGGAIASFSIHGNLSENSP